jgi:uncharacterized protein YjbI with pentapeptide repeats
MKVIKPQKLAVLHRTYEKAGKHYLAVTLGIFFPVDQPERLLPEVAMWKLIAEQLGKEAILDLGMPKLRGEAILRAKCFSRDATRTGMQVRFRLGSIDKTLWVFGNRQWRKNVTGSRIGDPQPFTEINIGWENAFGGPGFESNPVGKGIDSQGATAESLPNVEDPKHLVARPTDRPQPAGFWRYDLMWPQRISKIGTYDEDYLQSRFPYYAENLDWGIFNEAPIDQQIDGFFKCGTDFSCEGLHPTKAELRGRLPNVVARCFITQNVSAGTSFRELPAVADTLWLFPDLERAIILFRAVGEIATDDAYDVVHLVVGAESAGKPKTSEHYKKVLDERLDREHGILALLRESDLLPELPASEQQLPEESNEMDALVAQKNVPLKRARTRVENELANAKKEAGAQRDRILARTKALGLPPPDLSAYDKVLGQQLPPLKEYKLEEISNLNLSQLEKDLEALRADAALKQKEAETKIRERCVAQGIDYDKVTAAERAKAVGPPKFSAEQQLAEMQSVKREMAARGVTNKQLDAMLADPELGRKLRLVETEFNNGYRKYAHYFPAAPRMEPEHAKRVKDAIVAGHQKRESFAGKDFTGADFSGLNLSGADFKNAMMEGVDFSGSDLSKADLSGAVLARCVFKKTKLQGAKLKGTNLGKAEAEGSDFTGSDLTDATLTEAVLRGAKLNAANLTGADLMGAVLSQVDLSNAMIPQARVFETDLKGCVFDGANLTKAIFYKSPLTECSLKKSTLEGATLFSVDAQRIDATQANLKGLVAVIETSLKGANLKGAELNDANLRGIDLESAILTQSKLDRADLSEANLRGCDLQQCSAKGARLVRTDLHSAKMTQADLMEAVLQKAYLTKVTARRANLYRADFLKATIDADTDLGESNLKRTLLSAWRTK